MRLGRKALAAARAATLTGMGLAVGLPIAGFIGSSFLTRRAVLGGTFTFQDFTLAHYRQLFERVDVPQLLLSSTLLAVLSSAGAVMAGVAAAYFVSRGQGGLPKQVYAMCLSVWFVPPVALSLEIYLWFQRVGLYDRLSGLSLLYATVHASLLVVLLAPYWDAVSRRIDEAAWTDGWYGFQVIVRVHSAALAPVLAGTAALAFLRAWNELLFASILTDRRVVTLPVAMVGLTTGSHISWGQVAALGSIALLPAPLALAALWSALRGGLPVRPARSGFTWP